MKHLFAAALLLSMLGFSGTVLAMDISGYTEGNEGVAPKAEGLVLQEPKCFNLINQAPYGVTGTVVTNYYVDDRGVRARHHANFRLASGEKANFCTTGPFYDGEMVELVLRTLIPIFSCKTRIDADIVITGRKRDDGTTETKAVCLQ